MAKRQTIYYVYVNKERATVHETTARLEDDHVRLVGGQRTGFRERMRYEELPLKGFGWSHEEAVQSAMAMHRRTAESLRAQADDHDRKLALVKLLADKYGYEEVSEAVGADREVAAPAEAEEVAA